ncbi:Hypp768 [Branchiostoma lanceolatum]|uniref:Hypp768 protein n=1 Tax=Branchiostoma lanceolatum TaxID=7740 RepID=A0A8J9YRD3_BRALA|nr:Hypp768 [Branchiostoma lanceolatum]
MAEKLEEMSNDSTNEVESVPFSLDDLLQNTTAPHEAFKGQYSPHEIMFGHKHLSVAKPNPDGSYQPQHVHVVLPQDLAQARAAWISHVENLREDARKLNPEATDALVHYVTCRNGLCKGDRFVHMVRQRRGWGKGEQDDSAETSSAEDDDAETSSAEDDDDAETSSAEDDAEMSSAEDDPAETSSAEDDPAETSSAGDR